jgi:ABC-type transport system substrate-binding protein
MIDDRAFVVHLNSPRPNFAQTFFGPSGVPALPLLRTAPGAVPIGTGPFRIVRRYGGEYRWKLSRWPFSPRGAPHLAGIDLRIITSETTANVQLASGEADIALPLIADPIEASRFTIYPRLTSTAVLLFNGEGEFADVKTRRAFASAIDVPTLQRAYDRRRRTLLASLLLRGGNDLGFERALSHRPDAASELRARLGGRTITVVYVASSPSHARLAALLYDKVSSIGTINVDLEQRSGVLYQSAVGPLAKGRFDIAVWGFAYGPRPDLAADWSCRNRPPHGGNFSRWCDDELEQVIDRDPDAALRRLYETMACIPLSRAHENIGVGRHVRGFSLMPDLVPQTYGCTDWSLDSAT